MAHKRIVTPGDVHYKFTIIKESDRYITPCGEIKRMVLCKCECGTEKIVMLNLLTSGHVKSCGCLVKKHGGSHTPLFKVWSSMIERCTLKNSAAFKRYMGRGITVCDEWKKDFKKFKEWALSNGWKQGLVIDRINNDGSYSPDNCRIATVIVNSNNKGNTTYIDYHGKKIAFSLLLREKGLLHEYSAIKQRWRRGWDIDKAMVTPIKKIS